MLRELDRRALWVYVNFVSLHTSRNLTKPRNVLAAFNGVSNLLWKVLRAHFMFDLPSSHFDLAFLWEPGHALKHQTPRHDDEKKRAEYHSMSSQAGPGTAGWAARWSISLVWWRAI